MLKYCIMTLEEEAEASMSISFLNADHMLCDCVCDVLYFIRVSVNSCEGQRTMLGVNLCLSSCFRLRFSVAQSCVRQTG